MDCQSTGNLYPKLREIFGSGKYYFQLRIPEGENPIEHVTSQAVASVFVTILDGQVFAASNGYSDISSYLIIQEIQP